MRGRTILGITAGCVLFVGALILLYCYEPEPSYNGRTLSQWIHANSQAPDDREAHEAIVWITTNHSPLLLRWAFAQPNQRFSTMPRLGKLIWTLPFSLTQKPFMRRFLYREDEIARAAYALRAFELAGTNAVCAIPALARLVTDYNPGLTTQVFYVLSLLGPAAVPTIHRAMSSPDPFVRCAAIGSLRHFGTNSNEAIPDLIAALSDQDVNIRQNATNVLETLYPVALTNSIAR